MVTERPTIHLTNATSRKPPHRGPGRVWTIMARPRPAFGEAGEGAVDALVPEWVWVERARSGEWTMDLYRRVYLGQLADEDLGYDELMANTGQGSAHVEDGDTLICACSRAEAAAGRCHRAWAAELLKASGWRVILDGQELQ